MFAAGGANQQPLPSGDDAFPKIESGSANGLGAPATVLAAPVRASRKSPRKRRRSRKGKRQKRPR
jgi:hypothetical protein